MSDRIVYFMRGVPSCGKSTRARELAGNTGKVLEEDAYFKVSTENGIKYNCRTYDRNKARKYIYRELKRAMKQGVSPIIVDRDNAPSVYSKMLMNRVIKSGYTPMLAEPTSELWRNLRSMIENKERVDTKSFADFAHKLSILSQETHNVSSEKILGIIMRWLVNVTIEDFLNFKEENYNTFFYHCEIPESEK